MKKYRLGGELRVNGIVCIAAWQLLWLSTFRSSSRQNHETKVEETLPIATECRLSLVTPPLIQCWNIVTSFYNSLKPWISSGPRPKWPRYVEKMMAEMVHGIVDVMHRDLPKA